MTECRMPLLAVTHQAPTGDIVKAVLLLVGALLVLGIVLVLARRKRFQQEREDQGPIYTLHELREMLKSGKITQEEFDRLKDVVTSQTRQSGNKETGR